jgi:BASS family bile acid:Na+ symporter
MSLADFYINNEYWFASIQLILAMFGVGATLTASDFRDVARESKPVSIGTLVQLVLIPLSALLFISTLGLMGGIAVSIALLAAIPGGASSNFFTYFAHGNFALSICITAITTLACLFSTPIILDILIGDYMPASFVMPRVLIMREIALTLLLPLSLGMLYLYLLPKSAASLSKWSIRGSLLGIGLIVIGSGIAGRLNLDEFGVDNALTIVWLTLVFAFIGWFSGRITGLTRTDRTAIEMEVVVRNVNLGILINATLFPAAVEETATLGNTVLFALLLYGALQMLLAVGIIGLGRRSAAAQTAK